MRTVAVNSRLVLPGNNQRGAATLLVAVVLLIAVVGVTFLMSDVVIREKQFVANEYRAKQAFHIAHGGLDYGIAYMQVGSDQDDDNVLDTLASAAVGVGQYTVTLNDISSAADNSLIEVHATGYSDDGSVVRHIYQAFGELPLLATPPSVPVTAKGVFGATGNFSITNNYQNITTWAGEGVVNWGSANTYVSVDGVPDQLSTTKNTQGPDVIDGDENLANATEDELLETFFGVTWDEFANIATRSYDETDADSSNDFPGSPPSGALGVMYVNGDLGPWNGSNDTWGTTSEPVVIVVDGTFTMTGGPTINGVVIARNLDVQGGPTINGSIVSTGDLGGTGNYTVILNDSVIENLQNISVLGAVNGSWRDWQ